MEVTPTEKENQKLRFSTDVDVMEIENRFQMMDPEEWEDDDDYEIEIVEGTGAGGDDDADFYLEMIDGEIFYVFETEDDISLEEDESSSEEESMTQTSAEPAEPMQLDFAAMMGGQCGGEMGASLSNIDSGDLDASECDNSASKNEMSSQVEEATVAKSVSNNNGASITEGSPTQNSDLLPVSPVRQPSITLDLTDMEQNVALSPLESPTKSVKSILKSGPLSPTPTPKSPASVNTEKKERKKKEKKEKTFTKTFVRASDFDGEHRVYNWEKPTWTNQQLKSTGKGDDIRSGKNLANPITNAAKLIEKGQVKWEKPEWAAEESEHGGTESEDLNAKEELIRRIQGGHLNLPGLRRNKSRLKLSINGSILAEGGDIVKPITKATIIQKPNINYVANPKILRATPVGSRVKCGESLEAPVTQAASLGKYNWEKPSWVTKKLHQTAGGEKLKAGKDVAPPISAVKNKIEWEKPDWTLKRGMGRTLSAEAGKKEYSWEKPSWASGTRKVLSGGTSLRETPGGRELRQGAENLARPITDLPQIVSEKDNDVRPKPLQRTRSQD